MTAVCLIERCCNDAVVSIQVFTGGTRRHGNGMLQYANADHFAKVSLANNAIKLLLAIAAFAYANNWRKCRGFSILFGQF